MFSPEASADTAGRPPLLEWVLLEYLLDPVEIHPVGGDGPDFWMGPPPFLSKADKPHFISRDAQIGGILRDLQKRTEKRAFFSLTASRECH